MEKNAKKAFEILIKPELQFSLDVDAELHYSWFSFQAGLAYTSSAISGPNRDFIHRKKKYVEWEFSMYWACQLGF